MKRSSKHGFTLLGAATTAVLALCAASPALALNPGDTVDNFRLLDHTGASRELYYLSDSRASIEKTAKAQGIDLPILLDETQIIGESLGLERNGELLVIDTKGWKVAYRGPLAAGGKA